MAQQAKRLQEIRGQGPEFGPQNPDKMMPCGVHICSESGTQETGVGGQSELHSNSLTQRP